MLESLLKVKKDFQKTFKNLICFFFLLQPVPFYGQNYEKQKGPGTSYQSLFRLEDMLKKFICYTSIAWEILIISYEVVSELLLFYASHSTTSQLFQLYLTV